MKIDPNKQYRTRDGKAVRIYDTDAGGDYPIHGAVYLKAHNKWKIEIWTEDGRVSSMAARHEYDLVEYNPLMELKIDDKILVRDHETQSWSPRHFAGISETGRVKAFVNGGTSWSSGGSTNVWREWKLPEDC